jgi:hypothetical protein
MGRGGDSPCESLPNFHYSREAPSSECRLRIVKFVRSYYGSFLAFEKPVQVLLLPKFKPPFLSKKLCVRKKMKKKGRRAKIDLSIEGKVRRREKKKSGRSGWYVCRLAYAHICF